MRKIWFGLSAVATIISSSASATCEVGKLLEFKVTMQGETPLADIGINGHNLRFIVDSGAFFSNISPGTAQELGLPLERSPIEVSGIGGAARTTYLTEVRTLDLAGFPIHNVQFLVAGGEFGAAGLLGQNVLGLRDVEYDLGHGVVRLMRSKDCSEKDNLAYWARPSSVSDLAIEYRAQAFGHTVGTVVVNGVKLRAAFDTGAGSSVLSLGAAKRVGLTPSSAGVIATGLSRGVGFSMVQSWLAPVDSVTIGTEEVRHVKMFIEDTHDIGEADMLIGADFFLSHRVYVSNALHRMYFTYNGGPVFNTMPSRVLDHSGAVETIAADSGPDPTDADGYSRRGAAELSRRDYKAALADLNRAVAMAPRNGRYLLERAQAQFLTGNQAAAYADLDKAVQVAPTDPQIRLSHAGMLLVHDRKDEALKDVEAIDPILPPQADERFTLAVMFGQLDHFDRSLANYDLWIKNHPDDSRQPEALNDRCWTRALAGRDLPLAVKDCDSAIRRLKQATFFDSRGLVELRMGEYDRAIADYTQALQLAPKTAWSLYGRGLARRHKDDPAAEEDLNAAVAIDPALPSRAKALGIN